MDHSYDPDEDEREDLLLWSKLAGAFPGNREARMQGRLTLKRKDSQMAVLDDLTYGYYDLTNRRKNIDGSVNANYRYDEIGNLTADVAEGIDSIACRLMGRSGRCLRMTISRFISDTMPLRTER